MSNNSKLLVVNGGYLGDKPPEKLNINENIEEPMFPTSYIEGGYIEKETEIEEQILEREYLETVDEPPLLPTGMDETQNDKLQQAMNQATVPGICMDCD